MWQNYRVTPSSTRRVRGAVLRMRTCQQEKIPSTLATPHCTMTVTSINVLLFSFTQCLGSINARVHRFTVRQRPPQPHPSLIVHDCKEVVVSEQQVSEMVREIRTHGNKLVSRPDRRQHQSPPHPREEQRDTRSDTVAWPRAARPLSRWRDKLQRGAAGSRQAMLPARPGYCRRST